MRVDSKTMSDLNIESDGTIERISYKHVYWTIGAETESFEVDATC